MHCIQNLMRTDCEIRYITYIQTPYKAIWSDFLNFCYVANNISTIILKSTIPLSQQILRVCQIHCVQPLCFNCKEAYSQIWQSSPQTIEGHCVYFVFPILQFHYSFLFTYIFLVFVSCLKSSVEPDSYPLLDT